MNTRRAFFASLLGMSATGCATTRRKRSELASKEFILYVATERGEVIGITREGERVVIYDGRDGKATQISAVKE